VLVSKILGDEIKKVLDDPTKMVNLYQTKTSSLQNIKQNCENLDKQHINLLRHIKIRCLSRGRVLNRVFELKGE
jgi:hypothetical protein